MCKRPHMTTNNPLRSSVAVNHLAIAGWGSALIIVALGLIAIVPVLPPVTLHTAVRIVVITVCIAFAVLLVLFHLLPAPRSKDGF